MKKYFKLTNQTNYENAEGGVVFMPTGLVISNKEIKKLERSESSLKPKNGVSLKEIILANSEEVEVEYAFVVVDLSEDWHSPILKVGDIYSKEKIFNGWGEIKAGDGSGWNGTSLKQLNRFFENRDLWVEFERIVFDAKAKVEEVDQTKELKFEIVDTTYRKNPYISIGDVYTVKQLFDNFPFSTEGWDGQSLFMLNGLFFSNPNSYIKFKIAKGE